MRLKIRIKPASCSLKKAHLKQNDGGLKIKAWEKAYQARLKVNYKIKAENESRSGNIIIIRISQLRLRLVRLLT